MGRRLALVVVASWHRDEGLSRLAAGADDAGHLADVLGDPNVGGFEVRTLVDEPRERVTAAIDELFRRRQPDDVVLLYFSGLALRGDDGELHLATVDTRRDDLRSTAVPAGHLDQAIAAGASTQIVLVLDCCYGGTIPDGGPVVLGGPAGVLQRFGGPGRTVLSSPDTVQFGFEGDRLHGVAARSVFTRDLVQALKDGRAVGIPVVGGAGWAEPGLDPALATPPGAAPAAGPAPGFLSAAWMPWPAPSPSAPPSPPTPSAPHAGQPPSPGRSGSWTSPTRFGILATAVVLAAVAVTVVVTRSDGDGDAAAPRREVPESTVRPSTTSTTGRTGTTAGTGTSRGPVGAVDPRITEASAVGDADPACSGAPDGVLRIGELLPETGDLSFLYPPMSTGAAIAVQEINAAGGVLGKPVDYIPGDSGDESPDVASGTVDGHLQAGADVILGAAASGVSLNVLDTVTGACRVQFSPSNTSPAFLDHPDDDLYFRTAASDVLQGKVIADRAVADGVTKMAVVYREDAYGEGLDEFFGTWYEQEGGQVVVDRRYDPEDTDFSVEVAEVVSSDADGVVLIGFDESSRILHALFEQGFTPDEKAIYLVDGNTGNALGEDFAGQPGALEGVVGTYNAAELTDGFRQKMLDQAPNLVDFLYGPETYDAVIVSALAAESAGVDSAPDVARHINAVTRGGTECTGFAACRDLLAAGEDIDYTGQAGPLDFSRPGEPTKGSFAIETFGADNQIDTDLTEYVYAEV